MALARFEEGWRAYESRYDPKLRVPIATTPRVDFPQWRGENVTGKSFLIWHEQGFGDMIQFSRYVTMLKQRGAGSITFVTKAPTHTLMECLDGVDRVITFVPKMKLDTHDYWVLPLSIPLYFKTDLETIPAEPGYFKIPADKKASWAKKLPKQGIKIGISWKGSTEHTGDALRSLSSIRDLAPLWEVPGITFVSLQKGRAEDEAAAPPRDQPMLEFANDIHDFLDMAALIDNLDLVISIDSAPVHVAGALGKPVWVFIPYISDWRWLLDREDTRWYPTMRLFRQQERTDWGHVIRRVRDELGEWIVAGKKKNSSWLKRSRRA